MPRYPPERIVAELNLRDMKRVLCIGAHSDDIEIGCGGTILKMVRDDPSLEFLWVVFSAEGVRAEEARRSAEALLGPAAKKEIVTKTFRGSYFPSEWESIKDYFETLKDFAPDVIFVHYRDDRHQDHRVLSDLAWNTFRSHLILEYEIPKYDGDLGQPNVFVPLDPALSRLKARHICEQFGSQGSRQWFTEDTFLAAMRLRGIECAASSRYAEAFHCRKLVLA
jgi:LmbE family N-acetylglucosaminyl deacetylase